MDSSITSDVPIITLYVHSFLLLFALAPENWIPLIDGPSLLLP